MDGNGKGQAQLDRTLGSWAFRRTRCPPSRSCRSNLHPSLPAESLLRAAPLPALTRTKTTTARRSRNSAPNGTCLPEASSTGSSATAAARGCPRSGPLGTAAGAARPLTCRVTGARAGSATAPCICLPGFAPTVPKRTAQVRRAGSRPSWAHGAGQSGRSTGRRAGRNGGRSGAGRRGRSCVPHRARAPLAESENGRYRPRRASSRRGGAQPGRGGAERGWGGAPPGRGGTERRAEHKEGSRAGFGPAGRSVGVLGDRAVRGLGGAHPAARRLAVRGQAQTARAFSDSAS